MKRTLFITLLISLAILSSCTKSILIRPTTTTTTTTDYERDDSGEIIKETVTTTVSHEQQTFVNPFIRAEKIEALGKYEQRVASARMANSITNGINKLVNGQLPENVHPGHITNLVEVYGYTSSQPGDRVTKQIRSDTRDGGLGGIDFPSKSNSYASDELFIPPGFTRDRTKPEAFYWENYDPDHTTRIPYSYVKTIYENPKGRIADMILGKIEKNKNK